MLQHELEHLPAGATRTRSPVMTAAAQRAGRTPTFWTLGLVSQCHGPLFRALRWRVTAHKLVWLVFGCMQVNSTYVHTHEVNSPHNCRSYCVACPLLSVQLAPPLPAFRCYSTTATSQRPVATRCVVVAFLTLLPGLLHSVTLRVCPARSNENTARLQKNQKPKQPCAHVRE